MVRAVTVVGAGIAGMTAAHECAERGHRVRIVAADLGGECSPVAAALWSLPHVERSARVRRWAYRTLEALRRDASEAAGVREQSIRTVGLAPAPGDPWMREFLPARRLARAEELPADCGHGTVASVPLVDTSRYLPWLHERCRRAGVEFEQRRIGDLGQLDGADVVVLAAGAASAALVEDSGIRRVRTQVVRLTNPGLRRATVIRDGRLGPLFVIPRFDDVVVGGGVDSDPATAVDDAVTRELVRRASIAEPALADAAIIGAAVGHRPVRGTVRVERGRVRGRDVVHCYGHGGAGFALCWGTAETVADLIGAP